MRQWVYCSIQDSLQSSSDEGMQYSSETCESVQYSPEGNTIWKGSTGTVQNKYDFVQSSVLSTVQRHCDSVGYCSTVQGKCDWYSASTTCTVQRLILHSTTEQFRENVICTVLQLYGKVQLRVSISMLHMVQFQYSSDKTLIFTVFSTAQLSSVGLVENYEPEQFRSRISFKFYHHYNRKTPLEQLEYFVIYSLRIS